jgi:hypothetical protein
MNGDRGRRLVVLDALMLMALVFEITSKSPWGASRRARAALRLRACVLTVRSCEHSRVVAVDNSQQRVADALLEPPGRTARRPNRRIADSQRGAAQLLAVALFTTVLLGAAFVAAGVADRGSPLLCALLLQPRPVRAALIAIAAAGC